MGFFDRKDKKPTEPAASSAEVSAEKKPAPAGTVLPRLAEARTKLGERDIAGAIAIYDEVLATSGNRPDILVTISGDLGAGGYVKELVELVAPRYDAEKHGAAVGFNLLQAYIVMRDAGSAQHLLDLLFALKRPDLEARLFGFSNAVSELFVAEAETESVAADVVDTKINLVSISRPIWFYGLEAAAAQLIAKKEGRPRRVAFAHCAVINPDEQAALAAQPEHPLGRFARGFPLWLADTFHASAGYEPVAALGATGQKQFAHFPMEWVPENIRQLNESSDASLDFVVTSTLRCRHSDYELALRIWEMKKFRELKVFSTRWTPGTADEVLTKFVQQLRVYMEWTALPAGQGLAYATPPSPDHYIQALAVSLTHFLTEKGVIAPAAPVGTEVLLKSARANAGDMRAQLAVVSALVRQIALGFPIDEETLDYAKQFLASEPAQAAGISGLRLQLK